MDSGIHLDLHRTLLAALVKADSIGCYGSEFDVWLTADDELMLNPDGWHDGYSLEKTLLTCYALLKLSNGENMPTLEQFLDKAKKLKIHLILEMKPSVLRNVKRKPLK